MKGSHLKIENAATGMYAQRGPLSATFSLDQPCRQSETTPSMVQGGQAKDLVKKFGVFHTRVFKCAEFESYRVTENFSKVPEKKQRGQVM